MRDKGSATLLLNPRCYWGKNPTILVIPEFIVHLVVSVTTSHVVDRLNPKNMHPSGSSLGWKFETTTHSHLCTICSASIPSLDGQIKKNIFIEVWAGRSKITTNQQFSFGPEKSPFHRSADACSRLGKRLTWINMGDLTKQWALKQEEITELVLKKHKPK